MSTPPHLRRADADDAAEVTRLRLVMFASMGLVPEPDWTPVCETYFRERLAGDPQFVAYVIDAGDRLLSSSVGRYTWSLPRPGRAPYIGHIASVATDPGHRRQGYARLTFRAVHAHLVEAGCSRINLTATPEGEGLYRSLGYGDPTGPMPLTWTRPGEAHR
ncbi:Ribosomal protein S18 acetylase RimI [Streptomyces sp. 2131.1]|uniref:GNAT family N-acetyltransferase n=1 Tax=Streptomyces sp. 2131.1 TaxID=1855346 RepID=UPI0008998A2F|nr:GNAT family N-acetyltransferase [Streptomyces sp. 2131.1]SEE06467.1 Ribosomal protein S18 acetylase RimI [Streptomyces sp. 2131.1]